MVTLTLWDAGRALPSHICNAYVQHLILQNPIKAFIS